MYKSFDVIGVGAVVVDELFVLLHYPAPDEKVEIEQSLIQTGGPVPTALRQLVLYQKRGKKHLGEVNGSTSLSTSIEGI